MRRVRRTVCKTEPHGVRDSSVPLVNAALDKLVKSLPFHGKDYEFEPRTLYKRLFELALGQ